MTSRSCCYLGRGRVYFTAPLLARGGVNPAAWGREWGQNWPLPDVAGKTGDTSDARGLIMPPGRYVGNASGGAITLRTSRANTPTSRDIPADGDLLIEGAQLDVTLRAHSAANLAAALAGERHQHVGRRTTETISTASAQLASGALMPTRHLIDVTHEVSVKPSWRDWVEDREWRRTASGIELLQGFAAPLASHIDVSYVTLGGADLIEVLLDQRTELGIVYAGVNVANHQPVRAEIYRAQIIDSQNIALLPDAAGAISLSFALKPVRLASMRRPRWFRLIQSTQSGHA